MSRLHGKGGNLKKKLLTVIGKYINKYSKLLFMYKVTCKYKEGTFSLIKLLLNTKLLLGFYLVPLSIFYEKHEMWQLSVTF